jgi:flagellar biosynthesis protein FliR
MDTFIREAKAMTVSTKAKIKDGLSVGLAYLVCSAILDWHELYANGFPLHNLGWLIFSSILFGLVFGVFFRPVFGIASRYYAHNKRGK